MVLPLRFSLRVEVEIKRRADKSVLHRAEREGMKARQITEKYPAHKAKQLMENLRSKGLWYWDKDFPNDEEDPPAQPHDELLQGANEL